MSTPAPAPANGSNSVMIIVAVVVGLFVLVIAGILAVSVLGAAFFYVAAKPVPPPVSVPASAVAIPGDVVTAIRSTPDRADVFRDGVLYCGTPCEITAPEGTYLNLRIGYDGYTPQTRTVKAGDSVDVTLSPAP